MGYRIEYQTDQKRSHKIYSTMRLVLLTGLCFILFITLVESTWQEGAALIHGLSCDPETYMDISVLNDFATELQSGESPVIAAIAFCRDLLS